MVPDENILRKAELLAGFQLTHGLVCPSAKRRPAGQSRRARLCGMLVWNTSPQQPAKPKHNQCAVHYQKKLGSPLENRHAALAPVATYSVHIGQYGCKIPLPRIPLCFLGINKRKCQTAHVHRVLPGMVAAHDPNKWVSVEIRLEAGAGSEKGKFMQVCSPVSHIMQAAG